MAQHRHTSRPCRMWPMREVRQQRTERQQAERLRRQHSPFLPSAEQAGHPEFSCGATLRWHGRLVCGFSSRASVGTSGGRMAVQDGHPCFDGDAAKSYP